MATVRDLVKSSLRLIGAIATGESATADEQADAIDTLNDMLDSWSAEGLAVFATTKETFVLTTADGDYTWGPTGEIDSARPIELVAANYTGAGETFELPLQILSAEEWAMVADKTSQGQPAKIHLAGTYPLQTVYLHPVPNEAGTLSLYSKKPLSTFASSNEDVELPPGYAKALRYGLAIELAPEYGKQPDPALIIQFTEAKEIIQKQNVSPSILAMDLAVIGRGSVNIFTGE